MDAVDEGIPLPLPLPRAKYALKLIARSFEEAHWKKKKKKANWV